jgi:hypothetical protein
MPLARVNFSVTTPCSDTVPANIEYALGLNLREADAEPLKRLKIVANGPSAEDFFHTPLTIEPAADSLALNGAGQLFMKRGLAPTYWAVCDPQPMVAKFFEGPIPESTIYLVGSKCDRVVFDLLRDRDVRLWHINDYPIPGGGYRAVPTASSVTLTAMTLMRRLGYRVFETYGWDASYIDGRHHASEHPGVDPETNIQVCVGADVVPAKPPNKKVQRLLERIAALQARIPQVDQQFTGGRTFDTIHTWALETQDAIAQLQHAEYAVTIHGDGMMKAILQGAGMK